jgi:hypothetical protein
VPTLRRGTPFIPLDVATQAHQLDNECCKQALSLVDHGTGSLLMSDKGVSQLGDNAAQVMG